MKNLFFNSKDLPADAGQSVPLNQARLLEYIQTLFDNKASIDSNEGRRREIEPYLADYLDFIERAHNLYYQKLIRPEKQVTKEDPSFISGVLRGLELAKQKFYYDKGLAGDLSLVEQAVLALNSEKHNGNIT